MFHTQADWMADGDLHVFRAISGVPTLQRFSVVEVLSATPTYEVDIVFLDEDHQKSGRKFLCANLSKVVEVVLHADVVAAQVRVNSSGTSKNVVLGESIYEIFEAYLPCNLPQFFYKAKSGALISDAIDDVDIETVNRAKSIWVP